jgi:hypothetical protein
MSLRNRWVRILLFLGLALIFAAYFAFSTFLFSPTESDFPADVSTLVPRQVDFFLAKANLRGDVEPFPRLAAFKRISATKAWGQFERSAEFKSLDQRYGLSERYAELEALPSQLRGIDPLDLFGGRDVAIAGFFRGGDLAKADWAVYGRVGWTGKLGVSLLQYPRLFDLQAQGLDVKVESDHIALSGSRLPRPLFVHRIRDVVICSTSLELVQRAADLDARGGQDSFGQSAIYFDNIQHAPRNESEDELEFYVDWRALSEDLKLSGRWPDAQSPDVVPAFLGRMFQLGSLKSLAGVAGFKGGLQLDVRGDLSSELMTPVQRRLYGTRGAERSALLNQAARLAKADASLFIYAQANLGDLLRELLASSEQALRSNLEDLLRSTGEFPDTESFVNQLDALFKSRVALIVRPNDYPVNSAKDPPNDGRPIPAWAVVLWTDGSDKSRARIEELHQIIVRNQGRIGLEGRNAGDRGVFTNKGPGGVDLWEFWSKLIPGTGHIATAQYQDMYIISNSFLMTGEVVRVFITGGETYPRLSERAEFAPLLSSSLPQANLLVWVDPRSLGKIRRQFAQRAAEDEVSASIDWKSERARIEDQVLRESFPGKKRGELDEETQMKLNELVNPKIDELDKKLRSEQIPAVRAKYEREILYSEACSAFLALLALDPKNFQLSVRALVPMDE